MPKLTKSGEIISNEWDVLEKDAELTADLLASGNKLVHVKHYLANIDHLAELTHLGVWFDSDDNVYEAGEAVAHVPVIGVNFPLFADGRGFSIGRTLRDRYGFKGELCALGHFMQDQLFYLKRCGFDTFVVSEEANQESLVQSLQDFSEFYQAAVDQPSPLFRRRPQSRSNG